MSISNRWECKWWNSCTNFLLTKSRLIECVLAKCGVASTDSCAKQVINNFQSRHSMGNLLW